MAKTPNQAIGNHAAFHARLREKMDQHGMSARQVSLAVTGSATFIRDLFRGDRLPRSDNMHTLAAYLGTTPEWLLYGTDRPGADIVGEEAVTQRVMASARDFRLQNLPRDVPVLGSVLGCTNGDLGMDVPVETHMLDMGDVISFVRRPQGIAGSRDAYALYVSGDSMAPRYESGDLIYINPARPAARGDDVVIQLTDGSDSVVTALVKRLVRKSATEIEIEQFNPPRHIIIPMHRVRAIHRITPLSELLAL